MMKLTSKEASAPSFPRPSSAIAKHRLKRRLLAQPALGLAGGLGKHIRVPHVPLEPTQPSSSLESIVPAAGSRDASDAPSAVASVTPTSAVRDSSPETLSRPITSIATTTEQKSLHRLTTLPQFFTPASAVEVLMTGQLDFLYLTPDPSNAYKLCILPNYSDVVDFPGEVITMSKGGIVRQCSGDRAVAVHISLREYLTEYRIYAKLQEIPLFKQFRLWYFSLCCPAVPYLFCYCSVIFLFYILCSCRKAMKVWRYRVRGDLFRRRVSITAIAFKETVFHIIG